MKVRKFKTVGNISVKKEKVYEIENLVYLLQTTTDLDMILISEYWENAGNSTGYLRFYDCNMDRIFYVYDFECKAFEAGKTIKLLGIKPDEDDRKEIAERMGE